MPSASSSSSVGATIPSVKPSLAWSAATDTGASSGSDAMKPSPNRRSRSGSDARLSTATQAAVTMAAVRRWVRATASGLLRAAARLPGAGSGPPGHRLCRPRTAIRAGTSVTATTSPTSTDSAIAGPKPRNSADSATTRTPVPAVTVMPATTTMGVVRAVARTTAARPAPPERSSARSDDRKNTA